MQSVVSGKACCKGKIHNFLEQHLGRLARATVGHNDVMPLQNEQQQIRTKVYIFVLGTTKHKKPNKIPYTGRRTF